MSNVTLSQIRPMGLSQIRPKFVPSVPKSGTRNTMSLHRAKGLTNQARKCPIRPMFGTLFWPKANIPAAVPPTLEGGTACWDENLGQFGDR